MQTVAADVAGAAGCEGNDSPVRRGQLEDVLQFPGRSRRQPLVLAGAEQLGRPVRWVHVRELPGIAALLQGGELILTTGIALPTEPAKRQRYIDDLSATAVSGLVIELGPRFRQLTPDLVEGAEQCRLSLVALRHEVRLFGSSRSCTGTSPTHIGQLEASPRLM